MNEHEKAPVWLAIGAVGLFIVLAIATWVVQNMNEVCTGLFVLLMFAAIITLVFGSERGGG